MSSPPPTPAVPTSGEASEPIPARRGWPRRAIGVALGVLAVVLVAVVASFGPWHTDTRTQAFTSPIRRLVVEVDGQVLVRAGERTQVTLTREWR